MVLPRGRGGGVPLCMDIGYVPRERPPFLALNFRSAAYNFHKLQKNPFRSITILHFLADFPETIIFKISLILTRSSPPTAGSARAAASWQFRRGAFSRSKRFKLVPVPRIFALDRDLVPEPWPMFYFAAAHTYQNLG